MVSWLNNKNSFHHKKSALIIALILLFPISCNVFFSKAVSVKEVLIVDPEGLEGYSSIQQAINNASDGDVIIVRPGVYYENLVVNKSVSIVGENQMNTIIDGNSNWMTVVIKVNNAMLKDLTIQHGIVGVILNWETRGNQLINNTIVYNSYYGIYGDRCGRNTIANNNISHNGWHGIFLYASEPCVIENNSVSSNLAGGIFVRYSNGTSILNNNVFLNSAFGIYLLSDEDPERPSGLSTNNVVGYNHVFNNPCGIKICHFGKDVSLAHNKIHGNYIAHNELGLNLTGSRGNLFYGNNFVANLKQFHVYNTSENNWDAGCYIGGNYWSDYKSVDNFWGPDQSWLGSDGIGDEQYIIDATSKDNYPLMGPINMFNSGIWNGTAYTVDIVSNSTISNFKMDISKKTVSFNVTGLKDTGGFCRINVPNIIVEQLWMHNYTVLLNGEPWPFSHWTDATNTYIYISYKHSQHEVVIVPEFESAIMLFTSMLLTMLATMLARKKFKNNLS
jgi:parallel beta-helix repeat protein